MWQTLLPKECTFYFATWVDFLLLFDAGSLVAFFMFLRAEFKRNRETAAYFSVSLLSDAQDLRH